VNCFAVFSLGQNSSLIKVSGILEPEDGFKNVEIFS
jgi:hypothetical protein